MSYVRFAVTLLLALTVATATASVARADKPPECEIIFGCEALGVTSTIDLIRPPLCVGRFTWCGTTTFAAPGTYSTTFTVTNVGFVGTGPLESTFNLAEGYTYTDDTCSGRSLAPGKSCSITMTFTATNMITSYIGGVVFSGRIHKGWNPLARILLASHPASQAL